MFTNGFKKLAWSEKTKESYKRRAEAYGILAGDAAKARKENFGQYLLNPLVPGPLSEVSTRMARRMNARGATHPKATSLIPTVGLIAGGEAGKKEMHNASSKKKD